MIHNGDCLEVMLDMDRCAGYTMSGASGVMFNGETESRGAVAQVSHGFGRSNTVPLLTLEVGMKRIPLTQGKFALVDDEDYGRLAKHKWYYNCNYARRRHKKVRLWMHHAVIGRKPGFAVDHIDGNPLNNMRANLRFCAKGQNQHNRHKFYGGASKYKGVCLRKRDKRWVARITLDNKQYWLGAFGKEEDAARAYDTAARKYFEEFACCNFEEATT